MPIVKAGLVLGIISLGREERMAFTTGEIELVRTFADHAAIAIEVTSLSQRLKEKSAELEAANQGLTARVAQLVREHETEIRARERIDQDLRVAQLVQQHFLPKAVPNLPGWQIAAFYRPAAQVGGDFYDFVDLPDGRIALVIGDVTGHGVPAALVMATMRGLIRSEALRLLTPGAVLQRINHLLHMEIPPNMFVTCLYAILNPDTGALTYANAGHDLPFVRRGENQVEELRATGMPLGAMPDSGYEEKETVIALGDVILLHSDGLAEAHDSSRAMFGFPRMRALMGALGIGQELVDGLLASLHAFTGAAWEQEDDITLVTLARLGVTGHAAPLIALS